jgi:hypothetical protein
MSIKTSSTANPKPGTLIKVNQRGESEYVTVGSYRLRRVSGGWHLYIASGEGWGRPRRYGTRKLASAAIAEHMATGMVPRVPISLDSKVAMLAVQVAELQARNGGVQS